MAYNFVGTEVKEQRGVNFCQFIVQQSVYVVRYDRLAVTFMQALFLGRAVELRRCSDSSYSRHFAEKCRRLFSLQTSNKHRKRTVLFAEKRRLIHCATIDRSTTMVQKSDKSKTAFHMN